jgi:Flp pilus assembly protein TadG
MVEFALVFPIFILLLVGMFDLGHVVWVNNSISTASREAARLAVVHGGAWSQECPQGPLNPLWTGTVETADVCGFTPSSIVPPVDSRDGIKAEASRWLSGVGGTTTVSVCYGDVASCSGDIDEVGATNDRGTQVTVTVTTNVGLAAPAFFGLGDFTLSATSTMLVNH